MYRAPPRGRRVAFASLAVLAIATLSVASTCADSDSTIDINQTVVPGDYHDFPILVLRGETVEINVDVQSGPDLGFYFVDQTGFDELQSTWPAIPHTYVTELSSEGTGAMHRSGEAPSEGMFYLLITNSANNTQSAKVVGTMKSAAPLPNSLFTILLVAIAAVFVIATIAALLITRSVRSKGQQYAPPGAPTRQGEIHQHISAPKPVLQQTGRTCPKCGTTAASASVICAKCGAHL